jgi:hypothetical protein
MFLMYFSNLNLFLFCKINYGMISYSVVQTVMSILKLVRGTIYPLGQAYEL